MNHSPLSPVALEAAEQPARLATDAQHAVKDPPRRELDAPPVSLRELIGVVALVALADVTVYHGHGFTGAAVLLFVAPLLLWFAAPRPHGSPILWLLGGMLVLLAARLVWLGHWGLLICGGFLLTAFSMTLAGYLPYLHSIILFGLQSFFSGISGLAHYARFAGRLPLPNHRRLQWLSVVLPIAALVAFGGLFILANPALLTWFSESLSQVITRMRDWLLSISPPAGELLFWVLVTTLVAGLLRPLAYQISHSEWIDEWRQEYTRRNAGQSAPTTAPAAMYVPFRNTLLTVIVLFAVYLVFEFATLWFREFPQGFHYSGYAHEGAAWLTAALALATLVLSLVFRGAVLQDARRGKLYRLAWIWSAENFLLALAVYHRLLIYVDFNGMTRMRVVGFFGISTVVVGFVLVLWKIARRHHFLWLVQRQLWALAVALYLLALVPVDSLITRYNVKRILNGDPAPSVQISVHPMAADGIPYLLPLLDSRNEIIRQGIAALLAEHEQRTARRVLQQQQLGWTAYQWTDHALQRQLQAARAQWSEYVNSEQRSAALRRFHDYAYQWY